LQGQSNAKRGRPQNEPAAELARLRQENAQLKAQAAQAELIITAQKTCASLRANLAPEQGNAILMTALAELAQSIPVQAACEVFGFPRSNYSGCIKLDRHLPYSHVSLVTWRHTAPRKVPVKFAGG
jgi:hypothetical protein